MQTGFLLLCPILDLRFGTNIRRDSRMNGFCHKFKDELIQIESKGSVTQAKGLVSNRFVLVEVLSDLV